MPLLLSGVDSASARISKGEGYQGFLRMGMGREQFWPKKG
jgi:hypothetical protein